MEHPNKRVVIVGFGKTAVDMIILAMPRAKEVHHVSRTPRWLVPQRIADLHSTYSFFNRYGYRDDPELDAS